MGIPSTTTANLEEQARMYRMITDIVLNNDNCPSMVIWGIKDNDSWRSASNPLLYDSGMGKKKAWYSVRSALRHRTITNSAIRPLSYQGKTVSSLYNLAGQKVDSSYKGLVIMNGKKVVIK